VLAWRPQRSLLYAAIHPKHPAHRQLIAFLRAVKSVWPAIDPDGARQPVSETVPPIPQSGKWRGDLLQFVRRESRTLSLVLARIGGSIDAGDLALLGGYEALPGRRRGYGLKPQPHGLG